jgi:hypothetical protein
VALKLCSGQKPIKKTGHRQAANWFRNPLAGVDIGFLVYNAKPKYVSKGLFWGFLRRFESFAKILLS